MVNISELLINVVILKQPKMLSRLSPKGKWLSVKICSFLTADVAPPANRQDLTCSGIYAERGNPVIFLETGKRVVRQTERIAGIGNGKKRMPFCNEADTVCVETILTGAKAGRLPDGLN